MIGSLAPYAKSDGLHGRFARQASIGICRLARQNNIQPFESLGLLGPEERLIGWSHAGYSEVYLSNNPEEALLCWEGVELQVRPELADKIGNIGSVPALRRLSRHTEV